MSKRVYNSLKITDLKDMLSKTEKLYGDKIAYQIRVAEGKYKNYTHKEVRYMIDALGTALINLGLKDKRIGVIGENRFEWEIAYLSIVCGTGIVVPLDKSLPENELESLIQRSEIEAIFYTNKHAKEIEKIRYSHKNKLKHLISMETDRHQEGIYSLTELIKTGKKLLEQGNREFLDAKINPEVMNIMLFTSGTTSASKVVCLSHKNICTNLMDLGSILDVNENDTFLSVLPLHHVFECTVGFLLSLYKGSKTVFCDGLRHITSNLNEYHVSVMACVPAIYERIFKIIRKQIQREGKLEKILEDEEKYRDFPMEKKKEVFKEIHDLLGGKVKLLISGAASLDKNIEERYRLIGLNLVQGYGLTETSPVIGIGTNKYYRVGSIGKSVPSVTAKIVDENSEGIGELVVKGPSIMLEYYGDKKATRDALRDGWFYTGDLAKIDKDGYIFICGRKKSVIVLKNGKNIFPEEMENLVNKIEGVKESFIYGSKRINAEDQEDIMISAKIVFDKEVIKEFYNVKNTQDVYDYMLGEIKKINKSMPAYKAIRKITVTEEPLLKTTTNKIKRQANLDEIKKSENQNIG